MSSFWHVVIVLVVLCHVVLVLFHPPLCRSLPHFSLPWRPLKIASSANVILCHAVLCHELSSLQICRFLQYHTFYYNPFQYHPLFLLTLSCRTVFFHPFPNHPLFSLPLPIRPVFLHSKSNRPLFVLFLTSFTKSSSFRPLSCCPLQNRPLFVFYFEVRLPNHPLFDLFFWRPLIVKFPAVY